MEARRRPGRPRRRSTCRCRPAVAIASHACAHIGAVQVPIFSGFAAPAIAARLADSGAKVGDLRRRVAPPRRGARHDGDAERGERRARVESARLAPRRAAGQSARRGGRGDARAGRSALDRLGAAVPPRLHVGHDGPAEGGAPCPGRLPRLDRARGRVPDRRDRGDRVHFATDMGWIMGPWTVVGGGRVRRTVVFAEGAPDWPADRLWRLIEEERVTMLGVSPTLVRALIPKGEPEARPLVAAAICTTGEPWNRDPYLWLFARGRRRAGPDRQHLGRTEVGACFLSTVITEPIKPCSLGFPALGMAIDVVDTDGRSLVRGEVGELVCRQPWPGMTRGVLARPRALPRHVLAAVPRRLDARRLGVGRRGRLLVPARAQRRHAEHRRQADRPGRARVGGDRVRDRRRGGGGRHPARGEGRDGVALLRRAGREPRELDAELVAAPSRDELGKGVQARAGRLGWARCRRRGVRRSCGARCARRRSARIPAISRRSRTPSRWRRSRALPELDGQVALVTGGGRGIGANIARELADAARGSPWRRVRSDQLEALALESTRSPWSPMSRRATRSTRWCVPSRARSGRSTCSLRTPASRPRRRAPGRPNPSDWWHVFEVNVLGVYLCCRAVIPGMLQRGARAHRHHRQRRRRTSRARRTRRTPAQGRGLAASARSSREQLEGRIPVFVFSPRPRPHAR